MTGALMSSGMDPITANLASNVASNASKKYAGGLRESVIDPAIRYLKDDLTKNKQKLKKLVRKAMNEQEDNGYGLMMSSKSVSVPTAKGLMLSSKSVGLPNATGLMMSSRAIGRGRKKKVNI